MIGGVQKKILMTHDEDGNLVMTNAFADMMSEESKFEWKLVRERDDLTKMSRAIVWIDWNEDGSFKSQSDDPSIGRSLMMSPFTESFTWQTTIITEIVSHKEGYIKFKTTNSSYELSRINE